MRVLVLLAVLVAVQSVLGEPFKKIEIRPEEVSNGLQDFTVRFTPAETRSLDVVVFECVYRQEFPWTDADGKTSTKTIEPVGFKYKRKDVRFVSELDNHITFRVPVSAKRLVAMYGKTMFRDGHPITVGKMKITGMVGSKKVWRFTFAADTWSGQRATAR